MRSRLILGAALATAGACGSGGGASSGGSGAASGPASGAASGSTSGSGSAVAPRGAATAAPAATGGAAAGAVSGSRTTDGGPAGSAAAAAPTAPVPTDEHGVFDLGDNRLLAHRVVDGDLVVDASSAGFARYTRFGMPAPRWTLRAERDGVRAAAAERLASLDLPLTDEQVGAPLLVVRVWAPGPRTLAVKINGRRADDTAGSAQLDAGWQTVAIAVAPGRWVAGENQVVLETAPGKVARPAAPPGKGRHAPPPHAPHAAAAPAPHAAAAAPPDAAPPVAVKVAHHHHHRGDDAAAPAAAASAAAAARRAHADDRLAVAWLRVAARPVADGDPRGAAVYDAAARRYLLAGGAGLAWYALVPDGAHLVARVVGADCRVAVRATANDGSFAGGLISGAPGGADHVDLSPMSGKAVRLELTARDCPLAVVEDAHVAAPGPAPQLAARATPPRYVVLWMMDAFRAQSVRTFTPGARADVPNFDRLAKTGVVFRQYYDQGNESQTSHSSVWTSTYPAVHNVRLAGVGGTWFIRKQLAVVGELMRAAGFHTIGVTGNGFIDDDGGYSRGFEDFRNMMREKGIINGILYGDKVIGSALDKLGKSLDKPTFLFLGTVDTHGPWIARHPWLEQYDPGPYHGPFQEFGTAFDLGITSQSMGCSKIPPPRDIQRLRAIYDSAVSYQDARLGDFVAQLEKWGIYDQTLLIVTADHGEELFEHGRCGHGGSMAELLVHVPLLIHYPAGFPGGVVVDEGAEGIDVLPTILDAIGAAPPAQAQGQSLRPLAFGVGRGWARPSYSSYFEMAHTMRIGPWKANVGREGSPIIYDLARDPGETADVAPAHPIERRMLTDGLGLFLAERKVWKKADWGVVTDMTARAALELDPP